MSTTTDLEKQIADAQAQNKAASQQFSTIQAQLEANPAYQDLSPSELDKISPEYAAARADLNNSYAAVQSSKSELTATQFHEVANNYPGTTVADASAGGYVTTPDAPNTTDTAATTTDPVIASAPYTGDTSDLFGDTPKIGSTGGGYDPNNPSYGNESNSIGGDVAVTQTAAVGPNFSTETNGYDPNTEESVGGGYDPSLAGLSDPSNARLEASGLKPGGSNSGAPVSPSVAFQSVNGPAGAASASENDWRVRISLADRATIFYKDPSNTNSLMAPLIATNGVIFPYTPQINITHAAHYSPATPTHSNYPIQFYNNSEVSDISITGDFTVQSMEEGQYLMAAIYFFRSATKMFFGSGANVGNPPPVVFLDGYGSHYFPHVPCVISSFQHTLSNDVDYIEVPIITTTLQDVNVQNDNMNLGHVQLTAQEQQYVPSMLRSSPTNQNPNKQTTRTQFQSISQNTRVPTTSSVTITLKPVYSRAGLHDRFDLNKFASGQLLQDKNKGFGGFI